MQTETPTRPLLIAEIGNNHLGDVARARAMVAETLKSNVDCITFQVREQPFYEAPKTAHLRLQTNFFAKPRRWFTMRGGVSESPSAIYRRIGLLDAMGVDFWKTLSWDFRNETLRAALRTTGKPVFYSTGVSGMQDVLKARNSPDLILYPRVHLCELYFTNAHLVTNPTLCRASTSDSRPERQSVEDALSRG